MFNISLFLGMPISTLYDEALNQLDSPVRNIFISDSDDAYLKKIVCENQCYLGKIVGEGSHLVDIELLEKNIYSLLKKIIPNYPYEDVPLILFALQTP